MESTLSEANVFDMTAESVMLCARLVRLDEIMALGQHDSFRLPQLDLQIEQGVKVTVKMELGHSPGRHLQHIDDLAKVAKSDRVFMSFSVRHDQPRCL